MRIAFKVQANQTPEKYRYALLRALGLKEAQMTKPIKLRGPEEVALPEATRIALCGNSPPATLSVSEYQVSAIAAVEKVEELNRKLQAATFSEWQVWLRPDTDASTGPAIHTVEFSLAFA